MKETEENFLKFCYREIDCTTIDRIALADGMDFWIDDEGLFGRQKPNFYASAISTVLQWDGLLYGNVVASGIDYNEGETLSLPADWEKVITEYYNDLRDFDNELD